MQLLASGLAEVLRPVMIREKGSFFVGLTVLLAMRWYSIHDVANFKGVLRWQVFG